MSTFGVTERTSASYTATIEDAAGTPVALAAIVSAKLTLLDVETGTIINNRDEQDVKNANNVTIGAVNGSLAWNIQPEDNIIVANGSEYEMHKAIFDIVYATSQRIVHEFYLLVENVREVTV